MASLRSWFAGLALLVSSQALADEPPVIIAPPVVASPNISGSWCGEWIDFNSGHRGPLRADIRPCGSKVEVTFVGRFWKIFPFRYRVTLDIVGQEGDALILSGTQDLGLFGCFHYTARATSCNFVADFNSRRYSGQFRLAR
ncbi:MAG: hypothetical protein U0744_04065 [Gemmataceae bacterium]